MNPQHLLLEAVLVKNYDFICHQEYEEDEPCKICFEDMKNKCVLEQPCGHKYHLDCMLMTIIKCNKRECPNFACAIPYTNNALLT